MSTYGSVYANFFPLLYNINMMRSDRNKVNEKFKRAIEPYRSQCLVLNPKFVNSILLNTQFCSSNGAPVWIVTVIAIFVLENARNALLYQICAKSMSICRNGSQLSELTRENASIPTPDLRRREKSENSRHDNFFPIHNFFVYFLNIFFLGTKSSFLF